MLSQGLSKSIFITFYAPLCIIGTGAYIYFLGFDHIINIWIATVGLGVFPVFLVFAMLLKPQYLSDPHLTVLNMISSVNFIWGFIFTAIGVMHVVVLPAAAMGVIGTLAFTYWFSRTKSNRKKFIKVNQTLADFCLYDNDGNSVSNQDMLGKLKMLVFYRGTWCPVCIQQLQQIRQTFIKLNKQHIHLYCITVEQDKPSWQPFPSAEFIHFLYDRDEQVSKLFGINISQGVPLPLQVAGYKAQTVVPSILLVNAKNKVVFTEFSSNFRVRPMQEDYAQYFEILAR